MLGEMAALFRRFTRLAGVYLEARFRSQGFEEIDIHIAAREHHAGALDFQR